MEVEPIVLTKEKPKKDQKKTDAYLVQITHFAIAKAKEKRLILRDLRRTPSSSPARAPQAVSHCQQRELKAINEPRGGPGARVIVVFG